MATQFNLRRAKIYEVPYSFAAVLISISMVATAVGDFANVYNALGQVPNSKKIFNYGMHSYWIK